MILFCLCRKTGNHILRNATMGNDFTNIIDQFEILLPAMLPVHFFENRVTAGLNG